MTTITLQSPQVSFIGEKVCKILGVPKLKFYEAWFRENMEKRFMNFFSKHRSFQEDYALHFQMRHQEDILHAELTFYHQGHLSYPSDSLTVSFLKELQEISTEATGTAALWLKQYPAMITTIPELYLPILQSKSLKKVTAPKRPDSTDTYASNKSVVSEGKSMALMDSTMATGSTESQQHEETVNLAFFRSSSYVLHLLDPEEELLSGTSSIYVKRECLPNQTVDETNHEQFLSIGILNSQLIHNVLCKLMDLQQQTLSSTANVDNDTGDFTTKKVSIQTDEMLRRDQQQENNNISINLIASSVTKLSDRILELRKWLRELNYIETRIKHIVEDESIENEQVRYEYINQVIQVEFLKHNESITIIRSPSALNVLIENADPGRYGVDEELFDNANVIGYIQMSLDNLDRFRSNANEALRFLTQVKPLLKSDLSANELSLLLDTTLSSAPTYVHNTQNIRRLMRHFYKEFTQRPELPHEVIRLSTDNDVHTAVMEKILKFERKNNIWSEALKLAKTQIEDKSLPIAKLCKSDVFFKKEKTILTCQLTIVRTLKTHRHLLNKTASIPAIRNLKTTLDDTFTEDNPVSGEYASVVKWQALSDLVIQLLHLAKQQFNNQISNQLESKEISALMLLQYLVNYKHFVIDDKLRYMILNKIKIDTERALYQCFTCAEYSYKQDLPSLSDYGIAVRLATCHVHRLKKVGYLLQQVGTDQQSGDSIDHITVLKQGISSLELFIDSMKCDIDHERRLLTIPRSIFKTQALPQKESSKYKLQLNLNSYFYQLINDSIQLTERSNSCDTRILITGGGVGDYANLISLSSTIRIHEPHLRNLIQSYYSANLSTLDRPLIEPYLERIKKKLSTGLHIVTWFNISYSDVLQIGSQLITALEELKDKIKITCQKIEALLDEIANKQIWTNLTDLTSISLENNVIDSTLEYISERYENISWILISLELSLFNTYTGKRCELQDYYRYWEDKCGEAINTFIQRNITQIRDTILLDKAFSDNVEDESSNLNNNTDSVLQQSIICETGKFQLENLPEIVNEIILKFSALDRWIPKSCLKGSNSKRTWTPTIEADNEITVLVQQLNKIHERYMFVIMQEQRRRWRRNRDQQDIVTEQSQDLSTASDYKPSKRLKMLLLTSNKPIVSIADYVKACDVLEAAKSAMDASKSPTIHAFLNLIEKELLLANNKFYYELMFDIRQLMIALSNKLRQLRYEDLELDHKILTMDDGKQWLERHLEETKYLTYKFSKVVKANEWLLKRISGCTHLCENLINKICEQISRIESLLYYGWNLLSSLETFLDASWQTIKVEWLRKVVITERTKFISKTTCLPTCLQEFAINVIRVTENIERACDLICLLRKSYMSDEDWMQLMGSLNLYSRFTIGELLNAQTKNVNGTALIEHIAQLATKQRRLLDLVDNGKLEVEQKLMRTDEDAIIYYLRDIEQSQALLEKLHKQIVSALNLAKSELELSNSEAVKTAEEYSQWVRFIVNVIKSIGRIYCAVHYYPLVIAMINEDQKENTGSFYRTSTQSVQDYSAQDSDEAGLIRALQIRITRILESIFSAQRRLKPLLSTQHYNNMQVISLKQLAINEIAKNIHAISEMVNKIEQMHGIHLLPQFLYSKCSRLLLLPKTEFTDQSVLAKAVSCRDDKHYMWKIGLLDYMFDSTIQLVFDSVENENGENEVNVVGMKQANERIPQLHKIIYFENSIKSELVLTDWLNEIVRSMHEAIYKEVNTCIGKLKKRGVTTTDIDDSAIVCMVLAIRVEWTEKVEQSINGDLNINQIFKWIETMEQLLLSSSHDILLFLLMELKERTKELSKAPHLTIDCLVWQKQIRAYKSEEGGYSISMYSTKIYHSLEFRSIDSDQYMRGGLGCEDNSSIRIAQEDRLRHFIFESAHCKRPQCVPVLYNCQPNTLSILDWIAFTTGRQCCVILPCTTDPASNVFNLLSGCMKNGFVTCIDVTVSQRLNQQSLTDEISIEYNINAYYASLIKSIIRMEFRKRPATNGLMCVLNNGIELFSKSDSDIFRSFTVTATDDFDPIWRFIHCKNTRRRPLTASFDKSTVTKLTNWLQKEEDDLHKSEDKLMVLKRSLQMNTPVLIYGSRYGKTSLIQCAVPSTGYRVFRLIAYNTEIVSAVYKQVLAISQLYKTNTEQQVTLIIVIDFSSFNSWQNNKWISELLLFLQHRSISVWYEGVRRENRFVRVCLEYGGRESNIDYNRFKCLLPVHMENQSQAADNSTQDIRWQKSFVQLLVEHFMNTLLQQITSWLPQKNVTISNLLMLADEQSITHPNYPEYMLNWFLNIIRAFNIDQNRNSIEYALDKSLSKFNSLNVPMTTRELLEAGIYNIQSHKWISMKDTYIHSVISSQISQLRHRQKAILVVGTDENFVSLSCAIQILRDQESEHDEIMILDHRLDLADYFENKKGIQCRTLLVHRMPIENQADFFRCLIDNGGYLTGSLEWRNYHLTNLILFVNGVDLLQLDESARRLLERFHVFGLPHITDNQLIKILSKMYPMLQFEIVESIYNQFLDYIETHISNENYDIDTFQSMCRILDRTCILPDQNVEEIFENEFSHRLKLSRTLPKSEFKEAVNTSNNIPLQRQKSNDQYDKLQFLKQCNIEELSMFVPYRRLYKTFLHLKDALKMKYECIILEGHRGSGRRMLLRQISRGGNLNIVEYDGSKQLELRQRVAEHVLLKHHNKFKSINEPIIMLCENTNELHRDLLNMSTIIQWHEFQIDDLSEIVDYLLDEESSTLVKMLSELLLSIQFSILKKLGQGESGMFTIPMINQFIQMYNAKLKDEHRKQKDRKAHRINALNKIEQIFKELADLQSRVAERRMHLTEKKEKCDAINARLENLSEIQSQQRDNVIDVKHKLDQYLFTIEREKRQAEDELADVMPQLEQAKEALNNISKDNIAEMRSFTTPPQAVLLVGSCIAAYLSGNSEENKKSDKKKKTTSQVKTNVEKQITWPKVRTLMGDSNFLNDLQNRHPSNVSEFWASVLRRNLTKLRSHLLGPKRNTKDTADDNDKLLSMMRTKSFAGAGLLQYVLAVDQYLEVYKVIQPRLQSVQELDDNCKKGKVALEKLQNNVKEIDQKMKEYTTLLSKSQAEQIEIEEANYLMESHADVCERLANAFKLEQQRWLDEMLLMEKSAYLLPYSIAIQCAYYIFSGHLYPTDTDDRNTANSNLVTTAILKWSKQRGLEQQFNKEESSLMTLSSLGYLPGGENVLSIRASLSPLHDIHVAIITETSKSKIVILLDPYERMMDYYVHTLHQQYKLLSTRYITKQSLIATLDEAMKLGHRLFIECTGNLNEETIYELPMLLKSIEGTPRCHADFRAICAIRKYSDLPTNYNGEDNLMVTCYGSGIDQYTIWTILKYEKPRLHDEYLKFMQQASVDAAVRDELDQMLLVELNQSTGSILSNEPLLKTLEEACEKSIAIDNRLKSAGSMQLRINDELQMFNSIGEHLHNLYDLVDHRFSKFNRFIGLPLKCFTRIIDRSLDELVLTAGGANLNVEERLNYISNYVLCSFVHVLEISMTKEEQLLLRFLLCIFIEGHLNNINNSLIAGKLKQPAFDMDEWHQYEINLGVQRRYEMLTKSGAKDGYEQMQTAINQSETSESEWLSFLRESNGAIKWTSKLPLKIDSIISSYHRLILLCTLFPDRSAQYIHAYVNDEQRAKRLPSLMSQFQIDMDDLIAISGDNIPFIILTEEPHNIPYIPCKLNKQDKDEDQISLKQAAGAFTDEQILQLNALNLAEDQILEGLIQCQARGRWLIVLNAHLLSNESVIMFETNLRSKCESVSKKFRLWLVLSMIPLNMGCLLSKCIRIRSITRTKRCIISNIEQSNEVNKLYDILISMQNNGMHSTQLTTHEQVVDWLLQRLDTLSSNEIKDFIKNISCGHVCSGCNETCINSILEHCFDMSKLFTNKSEQTVKYKSTLSNNLLERLFPSLRSASRCDAIGDQPQYDITVINKFLNICIITKSSSKDEAAVIKSILDFYLKIIDRISVPLQNYQVQQIDQMHQLLMHDYECFIDELCGFKDNIVKWMCMCDKLVKLPSHISRALVFSEKFIKSDMSADDYVDMAVRKIRHYKTLLVDQSTIQSVNLSYLQHSELFLRSYIIHLGYKQRPGYETDVPEVNAKILLSNNTLENGSIIFNQLQLCNGSVDSNGQLSVFPLIDCKHRYYNIEITSPEQNNNMNVFIPVNYKRSSVCKPMITLKLESSHPQSLFNLVGTHFTA
ncbi:hypothetical protein GJ496_010391 [Pomphorhynchus laevis]|nr:hypothetical protein GJ496_010391 [Pomphorhynchus laevis]